MGENATGWGREWVGMDATVKIAMRIRGQACYRASKETKEGAAIPEERARRRVLTMLGRTGVPVFWTDPRIPMQTFLLWWVL